MWKLMRKKYGEAEQNPTRKKCFNFFNVGRKIIVRNNERGKMEEGIGKCYNIYIYMSYKNYIYEYKYLFIIIKL